MRKTIKFAVSMGEEEFRAMEAIRKKTGLTRSAFVRDAFRAWRESRRREAAKKAYVDGYRRVPEDPALAEGLAAASAKVLAGEDWP